MKMTLSSIDIKNIRRFPDLHLSFTDDKGGLIKHTFVMMQNGTGKTTIITLIKGLLDGSAEKWSSEEVISYKPLGSDIEEGSLRLSTFFDDKPYNYILKLNYKDGKAETYATTAASGGLGERRFPPALNDLFTQDFVNRFVFDGEQAAKTMDNNSNEAEDAIKYLYRLDVFDDILAENESILKSIQDAHGGAKGSNQSLKNLRTRRSNINKRLSDMNDQLSKINKDINDLEQKEKEKQDKIDVIDSKNSKLFAEKSKAIEAKNNYKTETDLLANNILATLKTPYLVSQDLCTRMSNLGDSMTKLKLPKSTSKDFFIELSNQTHCICGREITPVEKKAIRSRADLYLGSDTQSVLNDVKSSINNLNYDSTLEDLFSELQTATKELKRAENNISNIDIKLASAGGEEAETLRKEKEDIIKAITEKKTKKEILESNDESDPNLTEDINIHLAKKALKELDNKIATATASNAALYRRDEIKRIVEQIKQEATNKLKEEIIKKTNEKIEKVITDDIIQIESIEKCIQLSGKSGASAGQTLGVAYCFLGTLFEDAELLFPFIIDSPCGSMDFEKRRAVASILPSLFNQIISFVMSAEVERFADQFYSEKDAQFITVIADYNDNSIVVKNDQKFFDEYQRENKGKE